MVHQVVSAEVHLQIAAPPESFLHLLLTIPLARILRQVRVCVDVFRIILQQLLNKYACVSHSQWEGFSYVFYNGQQRVKLSPEVNQ